MKVTQAVRSGTRVELPAAVARPFEVYVNGVRQREINLVNPTFPYPGDVGSTEPTNRYLLAENRDMAYSQRLSAGIAQTISRRISTNVLYSYSYRFALLTGRNINTPVDGTNGSRPDPNFANIVVATSDASGRQHTMNASAKVNLGPLPPSASAAVVHPTTMQTRPAGRATLPA